MGLTYLTAGESHGKELVGIVDGIPSGISIIASRDIDPILRQRQQGYGRSYRQQIESDTAEIVSGVRFGITTGAPIAIKIQNKDWKNWTEKMSVLPNDAEYDRVTVPRPGHADLVGAIKYGHKDDIRNVLERASARETAMRVAIGAICSQVLYSIGIEGSSYVTSIGAISNTLPNFSDDIVAKNSSIQESSVRMLSTEATMQAEAAIDSAKKNGDTLGGTVRVEFYNVPAGIGSYVQWDRKLDARIAKGVISIQAVKAIGIGDGAEVAFQHGSQSHDEIIIEEGRFSRRSNRAGGIEGGMSNGMPIIVNASMKPISTLMQPLPSVDISTGETTAAHIERSDVCAVPALSIIVQQVVATELLSAILDTFGGDTIEELITRVNARRKKEYIR